MTRQDNTGAGIEFKVYREFKSIPFDDDIDAGVLWHITRTDKTAVPLAGYATLKLGDLGLTLTFDYATPAVLHSIILTPGTVRAAAHDRQGSVHTLLRTALGSNGLHFLDIDASTTDMQLTVQPQKSWKSLGSLAVMQTMLQRHSLPFDGLWAAETATRLWDIDMDLMEHCRSFMLRAAPALNALPPDWMNTLPRDELAELQRFGALAREFNVPVDSALLRELEETSETDLIRGLYTEMKRATSGLVGVLRPDWIHASVLPARAGPSWLSIESDGPPIASDPSAPSLIVDYTIPTGLLDWEAAEVSLSGDIVRLEVPLGPQRSPDSVTARCGVSVINDNGQLLAATVSMQLNDSRLIATLRVSRQDIRPGLFVVLHRDVNLKPATESAIQARRVDKYVQDIVDSNRLGESVTWLDRLPRDVNDEVQERGSIRTGQTPFLAERIRQLGPSVPQPAETTIPELPGLRSLAMAMGNFDLAAEAETLRLKAGGKQELELHEVDALILNSSQETRFELAELVAEADTW